MNTAMQTLMLRAWQQKNVLFYLVQIFVLVPLSWLFGALTALRRLAYKTGLFKSYALPMPVIIVGNINMGGSGKTPVVMWLVEQLKQRGYKPGVISRGYGATISEPISVNANSQASAIGDEPLLISRRCACPVFVGVDKVKAGEALLKAHPECNVIISDDGLQHYRLKRDVEIAVINGDALEAAYLLPAGPMREPSMRLNEVDAIVFNGKKTIESAYEMQLVGEQFYNLQNPNLTAKAVDFKDKNIKAIAGIGKPERFFAHLRNLGLTFAGMGFEDHHAFTAQDLDKLDCDALIMTEKDAVKCQAFAQPHYWVLPVEASIEGALLQVVLAKIEKKQG